MKALLYGSRTLWPVLLLIVLLGCSSEVDTQMRTLPSGRQVEVFRVFPQEGPRGTMLNYFYFTQYLGDPPMLEAEWAEILLDAQGEAEKAKARELILIASAKQHWLASLLRGSRSRSSLYHSDGHSWSKVRED